MSAAEQTPRIALRVGVYSPNARTRAQVVTAIGTTLHPDLPELAFTELATAPAVLSKLDEKQIDLLILDGEATPVGGMGLAKQIRDEYDPCPPLLVLIARTADRWLADWSRADATASLPVDPVELGSVMSTLIRANA
ncbi:response regulator transcription factor [Gordonia sp. X0973]|uniref:response regulator transcription factor n=1 Tax=Gordonia sp. X0973 TaxID=2742602 RepID=UPI000F534B89|nr:response regulator transcription factor [Gordonia sp. X0973]QKT05965.1 response regulator transcription factor [Gordonia sp. X0973]